MKKTKLTRSLLAACSVVALTAVMYGCTHDGDDPPAMTEQEACEADGGTWGDDGCTTAADKAAEMLMEQRAAIETAIGAASAAVAAVDNDSTDAEVSAADTAIANARSAIADAANVPAEEKAANTGTVDEIAGRLSAAKMARMDAMNEAEMAEREAMAATAAKLYAGIAAPNGDANTLAANDRAAAYNNAGTPTGAAVDTHILVSNSGETALTAPIVLSEDKKTAVAALYGWEGKRYADPDGGDMVEAMVYSNVGEPTEGAKFSATYTYNATLVDGSNTELTITSAGDTDVQGRIASPSFDQSAGKKEFELGANMVRVMVPGSYHGVSGTYNCTPTDANTKCSATVAASGFTLEGGTWTFKATNADDRLTDMPDTVYASYGWWIHKSADDSTYTASAFVDDKGDVPAATGITALQGTATYMGGAAGKYALSSSTGGTNDAGHFTARATLEADFGDDMITGTIDNFMGADGMSRNWSVELMEQTMTDGGLINGTDGQGAGGASMTKWTIDGTAGASSGEWSGSLQDNGDDGVPKVATGTFYTEYGTAGKMVGAFGANKQ